MENKIKVSDYLASFLHRAEMTTVFELIGGMTAHIIDSLVQHGGFKIVSVHHEQSAAFAAEGWARTTGKPGVAIASSGPGATNLLTGIGSCYFDSTPTIFITGQVNRNEMKGERKIRQLGFQEMEVVRMVEPITKGAWIVNSPEEFPETLSRAFAICQEGRPGPVLIDIPMDVQRSMITVPSQIEFLEPPVEWIEPNEAKEFLTAFLTSERPMVLAGGGLRLAQSIPEFREFIRRTRVPVVQSLMGLDSLTYSDPDRVGFIGTYGNRWANMAIAKSDALLVLGSRLDVRQTGSDILAFADGKKIFQVDISPGEIGNRVPTDHKLCCGLRDFFKATSSFLLDHDQTPRIAWHKRIDDFRREFPDDAENPGLGSVNPNLFIHLLSRVSHSAAGFVVDVGQHQMWVAQSIELSEGQRFITSGGMGSMGFALPAAVGVAFAQSNPVIVIAGDGGFQLNIQELQTIASHRLPLKIVIMNNRQLGMIRQFQDTYFDGRQQSSVSGYNAPDFVAVSRAYGIPAHRIDTDGDIVNGLDQLWASPDSPFLLEVTINEKVNAHPKMQFGEPLTRMEPYLD